VCDGPGRGGRSISSELAPADRHHTQSQVFFPRTKVSSVRNPIGSWLPTVRGENDCCIRYLPTVEKGRVSSSKKSGDLFSAALVGVGVVKSLSGLPCGPVVLVHTQNFQFFLKQKTHFWGRKLDLSYSAVGPSRTLSPISI
jgi:hypothetical protein